jgi:hypothetical protein
MRIAGHEEAMILGLLVKLEFEKKVGVRKGCLLRAQMVGFGLSRDRINNPSL